MFNAYQQTQGPDLERTMSKLENKGFVASFIARGSDKALFVGLYAIGSSRAMSYDEYWKVPAYIEMKRYGMRGMQGKRESLQWFDLKPLDHLSDWKGKLIIGWSERLWWRRAHSEKNDFQVTAILEDSALVSGMPEWDEIVLTWNELSVLPTHWITVLSEWRGIYYIHDALSGLGYVGSAYGTDNLYGRWSRYAAKGDGGNRLLKNRDQTNFRFSILQRVSPDMEARDVIRLESTWKERLHTRFPAGLNDN